jgi:adenylosuccinate lyase
MIDRYNCPEISSLWNDETRFTYFLRVELALLQSLEKANIVPVGVAAKIKNAKINLGRIQEIEKTTHHDVIAFCTSITEQFSPEDSKWFHYGVTSSDIIDTALSLQIRDSLKIILPQFEKLLSAIKKRAYEHEKSICMGRSHGIDAEPISFGLKLAGHYAEFKRRFTELTHFCNELSGQFSGAVGNYTILNPSIERDALKTLQLNIETHSTQVIPRDHLAKLISINALIACAVERLAVELRHLQHSDINEVHEGFKPGQKGSSTMPHKKNPISSENLTGLVRLLRSHIQIAMDNTLLWHERDISHSSNERMYLPDNLGILYYTLGRLTGLVENLVINTEAMETKVKSKFQHYSSYVLHFLLKHSTQPRDTIYASVQSAFFKAGKIDDVFNEIETLMTKEDLETLKSHLKSENLSHIYLKNSQEIFSRVFND